MTTRALGYVFVSFVGCCVGLLGGGCATSSPGAAKEAKPVDLENLKAVGGKANGLVVWTSSRTGRPHLFTMRTDGSDTKQLTKGPATDWHPRFSPDGQKILFSRSHEHDFVRESQANDEDAWDLYTVSIDGENIEKVVENATWGSWLGPDEIMFMRGSKILRTKAGSSEETKIMDTARYAIFEGSVIQQPELSPDGHLLALTLAGQHLQTGIWNIKHKTWTPVGAGSQISWAPDGASVYWVDDAGNGFSRVVHEAVTNGAPPEKVGPEDLVLVDLKGKRTREFFPRFSNDGKWLVFGSAINNLEHDLEDFEIYLWEAGSSSEHATRMTFHSANDRWPDVFVGAPGKAAPPEAETNDDASEAKKTEAKKIEEKKTSGSDEGAASEAKAPEPKAKALEAPPTERVAKQPANKPARAEPTPVPADDGAQGQSDDWDDAPKKPKAKPAAEAKPPAQDDESQAAPPSADEDAAPAAAPAPAKKHKKKRR